MGGAGRLFVVATPIGNLGDLAPRAADVLRSVDLIAAEDTRVTRRLLTAAGIRTKTLSYRDANEKRLAPELVARMSAGESIALVSDAGTPGVSDPGYRLVREAAQAGIEVVTVPGPSAVIALLSIAGLPTDRFAFEGFPPSAKGARTELLESWRGAGTTLVFYESPRRVVAFLREVAAALGNPEVAVGRELTKLHEEVLRGSAADVADRLEEAGVRGEVAIAIHVEPGGTPAESMDVEAEVRRLVARGLHARDIAQRLRPLGVARRRVYDLVRAIRANDA